ncbi:MAG: hypothetical protein E6G59_06735 [Actinobacteria bacterium]|nr:MAG: hypothetical protein E6G59_06735 [Actinomycetota bacterium]
MSEPAKSSTLIVRIRNMGRRDRTLAAVLIGLVVLAVLFLLLSGGGGGTIEGVNSPPVVRTSPTPTVTSTAPPETGQAFEGTGVNGGGNTSSAVTVTLVDIRKQSGKLVATVDVNGKDYNVSEGQTFADNFRVIELSSSCGTFVFGDERFSLCKGQQVNK